LIPLHRRLSYSERGYEKTLRSAFHVELSKSPSIRPLRRRVDGLDVDSSGICCRCQKLEECEFIGPCRRNDLKPWLVRPYLPNAWHSRLSLTFEIQRVNMPIILSGCAFGRAVKFQSGPTREAKLSEAALDHLRFIAINLCTGLSANRKRARGF